MSITKNKKVRSKRVLPKVHSFVRAFGLLQTKEMKGYNYKLALNRSQS